MWDIKLRLVFVLSPLGQPRVSGSVSPGAGVLVLHFLFYDQRTTPTGSFGGHYSFSTLSYLIWERIEEGNERSWYRW
jgi:hypothetical protein